MGLNVVFWSLPCVPAGLTVGLHCLFLGKGHHLPGRVCVEPSQLQARYLTLARESLRISQLQMGRFEWKQWKCALWAQPAGLCRRGRSLCHKEASWGDSSPCEMLSSYGSTSQESNWGRFVLRLRLFSNSSISECLEGKACTVKRCFSAVLSQRELAKSHWFAVGLQCSTWESAGAVLVRVWGHKGSGVPGTQMDQTADPTPGVQ